jgi:hypothetical protein
MDSHIDLSHAEAVEPRPLKVGVEFTWSTPITLTAIQYELPDLIEYSDPLWFRKPAPYAHYVVEGSSDNMNWTALADRTHGPWRGVQTDFLALTKLRKIRLRGTLSNGVTFGVKNGKAFRAN